MGETQGRDNSGGLGERQPLAQEPDAALQPLPFDSKPKSVSLGFKTEARGAEAWDAGPDKRQSKEHPSFLPSPPALPSLPINATSTQLFTSKLAPSPPGDPGTATPTILISPQL